MGNSFLGFVCWLYGCKGRCAGNGMQVYHSYSWVVNSIAWSGRGRSRDGYAIHWCLVLFYILSLILASFDFSSFISSIEPQNELVDQEWVICSCSGHTTHCTLLWLCVAFKCGQQMLRLLSAPPLLCARSLLYYTCPHTLETVVSQWEKSYISLRQHEKSKCLRQTKATFLVAVE